MMQGIYCKNCWAGISKERQADPAWDGDTCSEECRYELEELDLPWIGYDDEDDDDEPLIDDEWVPDDDREL